MRHGKITERGITIAYNRESELRDQEACNVAKRRTAQLARLSRPSSLAQQAPESAHPVTRTTNAKEDVDRHGHGYIATYGTTEARSVLW